MFSRSSLIKIFGLIVIAWFATALPYSWYSPLIALVLLVLLALPLIANTEKSERKKTFFVWIVLSLIAWCFEILSITTGFPYGWFTYGQNLGLLLFDIVPLALPFTWPILVISAWSFFQKPTLVTIPIATLLLLTFDFVLDPVAVATGMWNYAAGGWYYGVPWTNFFGWMLSGSIAFIFLYFIKLRVRKPASKSFLYHAVFWTGCCLWLQLWLPFAIGIVLCVYSAKTSLNQSHINNPSN